MKIQIAKSSGFCFGVRRAIDMCMSIAGGETPVYVLGDIVHNDHVVRDLQARGVKKIDRIKPLSGKGVLVISAHGVPKSVYKEASRSGFKIVDATCPKVKAICRTAEALEKKRANVIIIGDKGHVEVKSIAGHLRKRPITIESPEKIPVEKLKKMEQAFVVTQSTQSLENVRKVMKKLQDIIPEVLLYNTTCPTTIYKQKEIVKLAKNNGCVLIVGSKTSANTKRLYQISKKINKKTHWVDSALDLKKNWFRRVKKTGIMAGASTPDSVVENITSKLKSY